LAGEKMIIIDENSMLKSEKWKRREEYKKRFSTRALKKGNSGMHAFEKSLCQEFFSTILIKFFSNTLKT
jgi:hypothetical protein